MPMILIATLASITLLPVLAGGNVVAYEGKADFQGVERTIVVPKHMASPLNDAITAGGGQKIIVKREDGLNVLFGSRDEALNDSLKTAAVEHKAALRAAEPLSHAVSDLAMARIMLSAARADPIIHADVPVNWVSDHERTVALMEQKVVDLMLMV